MMVCHCNAITDKDIHAAMEWMRAADPETIITPGKVYRALGKKADCGDCLSLFLDTMERDPNLEVPLLRTPAMDRIGKARRVGER